MHRVLVCAATRAEHRACERGIQASSRSTAYQVLFTGVGPLRAARSLGERLVREPLPDLIVSSGFAAALSPSLALSSWITAIRVAEWNGVARVPIEGAALVEGPSWLERCDVVSSSTLVAGDAPIPSGSAPVVVDMESAALAREAARSGVPFAVLRLISDTPENPLPAFMSPFAAALSATTAASRLTHAVRGLGGALVDPAGVARLVRSGSAWLRELEEGWRRLALWPEAD